ncbi:MULTISPECIES: hypothetical protein [unclassified Streptomyces]|uniref:hypothetical protein n=1 Tax=unclassified Streptomyces TaxID=2593676 RepID=UPI0011C90AC9|nr:MULTISPECIES: hypothetical protein [unclassified Streptomyces]TXS12225.1 hypothetical protein EAO68_23670 [Streptomyces sp. wa22]WSQ84291.1 hypothetical protein OG722_08025 [Streptomyces sp. NBC_01212]
MLTMTAFEDSSFSFWPRVREIAVPPSMIETATARRCAGDWAGACAAAGFDVDLDLRTVARVHGSGLAARLRADLRRLAPDLLRWHMPRTAPDGLLRTGTTVTLARYDEPGRPRPVRLVVRTAPAWAEGGQRISLTVWDGLAPHGRGHGPRGYRPPDRRFRLDLHRHLWDAGRSHELRPRTGADGAGPFDGPVPVWASRVPGPERFALGRWADEAALLLAAEGRTGGGEVAVRLGGRHRLLLDVRPSPGPPGEAGGPSEVRSARYVKAGACAGLPVLPDAAARVLPDLELLRRGLVAPERLHPLVAAALAPGTSASGSLRTDDDGPPREVDCRGARHRIGLVGGVLVPLDHDPAEIRREELLAALTGTPLPCLQVIDVAHRRPDCLADVRDRLAHGDPAGALAGIERMLGAEARLRDGDLRDLFTDAARQRVRHGLFRAGLADPGPREPVTGRERYRVGLHRTRPRNAAYR